MHQNMQQECFCIRLERIARLNIVQNNMRVSGVIKDRLIIVSLLGSVPIEPRNIKFYPPLAPLAEPDREVPNANDRV